ncbi:MAG: molybdopterin-dependent oxidoreductase [Steroidobacteraceae bacterium]
MQTANRTTTYTHCQICVQICGLAVSTENGKVVDIQPDKRHPHWRDFCIKAAKAHEILDHPKRITSSMKRVDGRYVAVPYRQAIQEIATQMVSIIQESGPDSVASYLGNPSMGNFGSAAFMSLFMGAIGSRSQYTVGSIDHNAWHVVNNAMYGAAGAMLQPDIDRCRYLLLWGANPAVSKFGWNYSKPDGWKRALQAQEEGRLEIVVVDPRTTESARKARRHVAPLPETDWAIQLGMLKCIIESGWHEPDVSARINGFDELRTLVKAISLDDLAAHADVPPTKIAALARGFATAPAAVSQANTGPAQGRNGTLIIWLSHVLNLITGNLSRPGGLYHTRGAIRLLENSASLFPAVAVKSRVRGLPGVAGALSLAELPDEINTPGKGRVRSLIINGGNPVISGPDGKALDEALEKLDLLIAVDMFQRESHRHAHWLIPVPHFLELDEFALLQQEVSGEPHLKMLNKVVDKPPGTPYEWEFFRDLALAMDKPLLQGKKLLNYAVKASILWSRITGNPYDGLSPKTLAKALLKKGGVTKYDDVSRTAHGLPLNEEPDFAYFLSHLQTPDGKANAAPAPFVQELRRLISGLGPRADIDEFPLQLINRRRVHMMNSWLTESSMKSMKERGGDHIELCAEDAARFGVADGARVRVRSATSSIEARVSITATIRRGVAVMGHGWGGRTFNPHTGEAVAAEGVNRNRLVSNRDLDPFSGVPRLNGTPIAIDPVASR